MFPADSFFITPFVLCNTKVSITKLPLKQALDQPVLLRSIFLSIKQAFDDGARDYDAARKQLIPCFDDFYGTAVELIPFSKNDKIKVLDIGAGTGLFASLVTEKYKKAELTLYDVSGKMLEEAKKRFESSDLEIKYVEKDYFKEEIEGEYDLIISALSIHHLSHSEKQKLFSKLFSVLKESGIFINADQALGESPEIEKAYQTFWLEKVKENDVSEASLSSALERMKEDQMSTLSDQLKWLKQANFSEVNCWYQNYSFVVYSGRKRVNT